MARLQDFPTVTPTSSDKLLVVQSQSQGLVPYGSKLDSANPTGTGSLSLNRKANTTIGNQSVAVGYNCEASGVSSFSEGANNVSSGNYSHSEGYQATASSDMAHAEGNGTTASGMYSHAEGIGTTASGNNGSHAEGYNTVSSGAYGCHAEGNGTIANHVAQHVFGAYNEADDSTAASTSRGNYVEIVGKGVSSTNRSNARTLDWNGNEVLAGNLTINGDVNVGNAITKNAITITAEQGVTSNVQVSGGCINGLVAFTALLRVTASASAWTNIATVNYKPSVACTYFALRLSNGNLVGMIQVLTTGVVRIYPTVALSANDITFTANYST